jgi:hypothetical protein
MPIEISANAAYHAVADNRKTNGVEILAYGPERHEDHQANSCDGEQLR